MNSINIEVINLSKGDKCGELFQVMSKDSLFDMEGIVVEKLPNAMFKVKLNNNGHIVLCRIAGKLSKNRINIDVGDNVRVEMSVYDMDRGRISWRL